MTSLTTPEIFAKLLEDEEFKNNYFMIFLDRFVYETADIEKLESTESRKMIIANLLEAFNYLISNENEKMSPFDIIAVGDVINKEVGMAGFRKINVTAGRYANWTPIHPSKIYMAMYSLFDNYYNLWNIRDVYEKEAAFHINLMRIHPFEDGNKRTAKLVMNANFIKQNIPPVIITEDETDMYYQFINNEDIMGFAKFLKSKSLQELNFLMSMYKNVKHIPITESLTDDVFANSRN